MPITYSSQIASLFPSYVATDAAYQVPGTFKIPAKFLNGSVTGVTVSGGSGYTTSTGIPTIGFSGGGNGSGATAVVAYMKATSANITGGGASGGTGYAANDTITLSNGVVLKVSTVSSGVITALTVQTAGQFTTAASLITQPTISSTSGVGTGAIINVLYTVGAVTVTSGGANYNSAPTVSFTSSGSPTVPTGTATVSTESTIEINILTLVEVLRSYCTTIGSKSEAKLVSTILTHAGGALAGYQGNATNTAAKVQKVMMHIFANGNRKTL